MEKKVIKRGEFLKLHRHHSSAILIAFIGGVFAATLFFCGELSKQGLSISLLFYFVIGICGILHQTLSARRRFCGSFNLIENKENNQLCSYELKIQLPHYYHSACMQFSIELIYQDGTTLQLEKKFFDGWDKNRIYVSIATTTPAICIVFYDKTNHCSESFSLIKREVL